MGKLRYGVQTIDVPDRTLAHLQVIIIDKFRRGESLTATLPTQGGSDRNLTLGPRMEVGFVYDGNRQPRLNRLWLEALSQSAHSVGGLRVTPEPAEFVAFDTNRNV